MPTITRAQLALQRAQEENQLLLTPHEAAQILLSLSLVLIIKRP